MNTDRPTLRLDTPEWIRQAKANDEQIRYAISTIDEAIKLKSVAKEHNTRERDAYGTNADKASNDASRRSYIATMLRARVRIAELELEIHELACSRVELVKELRS